MSTLRKYLPWASLALCAILLVLMLIDLIRPDLYLFLRSFTKLYVLITCLAASCCGILLSARLREALRRAQSRQQNPPPRPAYSRGQGDPRRQSYARQQGYDRSRSYSRDPQRPYSPSRRRY